MTATAIIIPARYGSTRFPGKPLHPIAGKPMVERMVRLALTSVNEKNVVIAVASDDERILDFVNQLNLEDVHAVMTADDCVTGTDRVAEAAKSLAQSYRIDAVINLQGDAVLTPPWVISAMVDSIEKSPHDIATPAVQMDYETLEKLKEAKAEGEVSGTTVTFRKDRRALYFSKGLIPFLRDSTKPADPKALSPVWRHIGLYAYKYDSLMELCNLPESGLEALEKLEQLRALENGMEIEIVPVDYKGRTHWGVDTLQDALRVEALIQTEGELF